VSRPLIGKENYKGPKGKAISSLGRANRRTARKSRGYHCYNAGKVHLHKGYLKSGIFEIPLVAPMVTICIGSKASIR
jgi:hypothetical protein